MGKSEIVFRNNVLNTSVLDAGILCWSYTKHDSNQIDHIFTTSRRPRRDEAGVF